MRRGIDSDIADACDRQLAGRTTPFVAWGRVLEVNCPVAGTSRDIPHGLGLVPTGFVVLAAEGGNVQALNVATWTDTVATLVADADFTRARLVFVVTEDLVNVAT